MNWAISQLHWLTQFHWRQSHAIINQPITHRRKSNLYLNGLHFKDWDHSIKFPIKIFTKSLLYDKLAFSDKNYIRCSVESTSLAVNKEFIHHIFWNKLCTLHVQTYNPRTKQRGCEVTKWRHMPCSCTLVFTHLTVWKHSPHELDWPMQDHAKIVGETTACDANLRVSLPVKRELPNRHAWIKVHFG